MVPINESNVEDVKKVYKSYLKELVEEGMDYEQAQKEAQGKSLRLHEDLQHVLKSYKSKKHIKIRKIIDINDIVIALKEEWDSISQEKKESTLWELGFNIPKAGYWEEIGYIRKGNKTILCKYILSEERVDKEWVNKIVDGVRVASMDAQIYASGDKSMWNEIRRLGGGRRGI